MRLFKKFATVSLSILGSRIFGFIRETLMATVLGIGPVADVFYAAFRFPNLFRRLLAEGIFNAAFIPLFSKEIENNGVDSASRFSEEIFGILFSVLLGFTILIELMMPFIVRFILAPGFSNDPSKYYLTVKLSIVMFPYLMCMSLTAMMSALLNSLRHYFIAAISPIFLNIIMVSALIYILSHSATAQDAAWILSWSVLASGIVQLLVLWIAVKNAGINIHLRKPRITYNIKKFVVLALPIAITGSVTQINQLIGQAIASNKSGAISSLQYADRIYQLPLGTIGIAIGIVLLPELSHALKKAQKKEILWLQSRSIEFGFFLTIPAVFALCSLSEEIIRVIYEHGAFTPYNTSIVSSILFVYSLGLPGFVIIKTFQPSFYAQGNTRTPMIFTLISVSINCILIILLFPYIGVRGIACAEVVSGWVNAIFLTITLLKNQQLSFKKESIHRILGILVASSVMLMLIIALKSQFSHLLISENNLFNQVKALGMIIVVSISVYIPLACFFSGIDLLSALKDSRK